MFAVCNNHFDTDGLLALFAILHPAEALERKEALLAAARAGDFFQVPSEAAFIVDAIVSGIADPARSPWREQFAGLSDTERYELCTRELLPRLAGLLDGDTAEFESLWQPALDDLRTDQAHLAQCGMDELVHLDACVWTTPEDAGFDIGRHALFGATGCDKDLADRPFQGWCNVPLPARYAILVRPARRHDAAATEPRPARGEAGTRPRARRQKTRTPGVTSKRRAPRRNCGSEPQTSNSSPRAPTTCWRRVRSTLSR